MNRKAQKLVFTTSKKDPNTLIISQVILNSTSLKGLLEILTRRINLGVKTLIVTPNPEFIVKAQTDLEFRQILNQADLAIPDGYGLVLASRFLGTKPQIVHRVAGADVVEELLAWAQQKKWQVGLVGARRGKIKERCLLAEKLHQKYPTVDFANLEETPGWEKKDWDLIFACQGMGKQERWLAANKDKVKAKVLMGIGGSLDFIAGLTPRAPRFLRDLGLEWLWRLLLNPRHIKRIYTALVLFPWLILKERFNLSQG